MKLINFKRPDKRDKEYREGTKKAIDETDCYLVIYYDETNGEVTWGRDNLSSIRALAFLEIIKQKILNSVVVDEDS